MINICIRKKHTHTHRRGETVQRQNYRRDVATSQKMSTATGRWKSKGRLSLKYPEGMVPGQNFDFNFWFPEL